MGWGRKRRENSCLHQWRTISQSFAPPRGNLKHVRNADEEMLLRLQYGMTTATQRCTACGFQRSYTVPGNARVQLDAEREAVMLKQPEPISKDDIEDAISALSDDIESRRLRIAAEHREQLQRRTQT